MSELINLLSNLDLEHCKDILLENGIELLQDVAQLTADDLEGLGLDAVVVGVSSQERRAR